MKRIRKLMAIVILLHLTLPLAIHAQAPVMLQKGRGKYPNMKALRDRLAEQHDSLQELVERQIRTILKSEKLKRYLPPQLVDSLLKCDEAEILERKTERRNLTVFFSDIKDFTETTDRMQPEKLSFLLNDYLSEMTKIASKWGGTIDKFIGDAVMAHFGAFDARSDREEARACVSMAREMQERMADLQEKWRQEGITHPFRIRCGINTGYCTVGNFGSDERIDYTAIGREVNLASRLEEAAEPGGILVSESTALLTNDVFEYTEQGEIEVKGFRQPVRVFEAVV